jgi:hypothetical protein
MREITSHIVEGGPPMVQVFAEDELGPGGAPHHYEIAWRIASPGKLRADGGRDNVPCGCKICEGIATAVVRIDFQKGGVTEAGSVNGVTHEALLAIIVDRLEHFQKGPFPSGANDMALDHCREALRQLQKRTRDRIQRGVEGASAA